VACLKVHFSPVGTSENSPAIHLLSGNCNKTPCISDIFRGRYR
jgi:hypothetical protein